MKTGNKILLIITIILFLAGIYLEIANAASSTGSNIISGNTEISGNVATVYSGDVFKKINGEWYDFTSYANINIDNKNSFNLTTATRDFISLEPYIVYNSQIYKYRDIPTLTANQVKIYPAFLKTRNGFKFSYNITTISGITEVGFYYKGMNHTANILYNKIITISFDDLLNNGYRVSIDDNYVKITNLKNGFNDLDPYFQFNSSSIDGYCYAQYDNLANVISCLSTGIGILIGYDVDVDYDVENRGYYSFNTSALNQTANITEAYLYFYSYVIADTCGGAHTYDIYSGSFIGDTLDITDFGKASYYETYADLITNPIAVYSSVSTDNINKTGYTDYEIKPSWVHTEICTERNTIGSSSNGIKIRRPYLNITYETIIPPTPPVITNVNCNLSYLDVGNFSKSFPFIVVCINNMEGLILKPT